MYPGRPFGGRRKLIPIRVLTIVGDLKAHSELVDLNVRAAREDELAGSVRLDCLPDAPANK
jgi:hypothetical protein